MTEREQTIARDARIEQTIKRIERFNTFTENERACVAAELQVFAIQCERDQIAVTREYLRFPKLT